MADEYELNAKITADDSGFQSVFGRMEGALGSWGLHLDTMYTKGASFFKGFGIDIDQFASKLGMTGPTLATVGAIAATVGKEIFELGKEFDEASANIAKGTGAVGDALNSLNADFNNFLSQGVEQTDIKDLSNAFADLNTLLGLSGKEIQQASLWFADFADVTNQSVKQAVDSVTLVVNKWGISLDKIPGLLDQITVASQMSGAGANELTYILQRSGTQLQSFGLSMTDSIAMFGYFAKNGVNSTSVMMGLNTALAKFSAEGKNAADGFKETVKKIQEAKSPTEAMTVAVDAFGQRAGPELANALRSGKGGIDDFKNALLNAKGAVESTDEASKTFADYLAALQNKVKSTFAPLGESFINTANIVIDTLTKIFDKLAPLIRPIVGIISAVINSIVEIIGEFTNAWSDASDEFDYSAKAIKAGFEGLYEWIKTDLGNIVTIIKNAIGLVSALMQGDWDKAWKYTKLIVLQAVKTVLDNASGMVNGVVSVINVMITGINKVLAPFGTKIPEMARVALSETIGLNTEIAKLNDDLKKKTSTNLDDIGKDIKDHSKDAAADAALLLEKREKAEEEYQKAQKATQDKFDLGVINYAEKIEQQKSNLNTLINKLIDLGDTNSSVLLAAIEEWKSLGLQIDAFNGKIVDAAQNMRDFKAMEREWEASQKALNQALLEEQDGALARALENYKYENDVNRKANEEKAKAYQEFLNKKYARDEAYYHGTEALDEEDRIEKYKINEAILEDGLLFLSRELENYKATISKEVEYRGDAVEQDKKLMAEQNDALLKAYADYLGISIEKLKELIEARKQAEIDMADISIATQNKLQDEQLNALIRALAEYNGISFDAMKKRLANEETAEKDAIDFKTSMAQLALDNSENLQKESYDNLIQALADYNGLSLAAMKKKLKDEEEAISVSNQLRLSMAELAIDNEKALLDDSYNNLIRALAEYNGISFAEMQAVIKNEQEKEAAAARWRAFRQSENNAELSDQEKLANDLLNYQDGALERELKDYQTVTDNQKTELEKRKTGWDSYGAYLDEMRQKQKEKDAADNAAKVANFVSAMRTIQRSVSQVFRAIGGEGSNILSDFADTVTNIASAAAQGFENVGADIQAAVSLIGLAGEANAEKLKTLQDGLGELAGELMTALAPVLELVLDLLIAFMPILKPIIQIIGVILNALKPLFDIIKAIADIIVYLVGGFFKIIAWLLGIKDTTEQVTDATTSYADALKDVNDELKDNKDLFTDASNSANAYTSILTKVTKKVADFYKSLQDVGTDIATTLVDNLTSGLTESDFLTSMKEYIIKMVIQAAVFTAELSDKIAAIGKMIADGIANGMSETDLASIRAQLQALYQSASTAAAQATAIVDTSFAGYASGTSSATEGAHKLAESGPELVVNPTVRYLNQGTKVYNAQDTAKILSGNKSTVVNATFNSPKALSAYDMQRKMRQYNRSLAFNGVL